MEDFSKNSRKNSKLNEKTKNSRKKLNASRTCPLPPSQVMLKQSLLQMDIKIMGIFQIPAHLDRVSCYQGFLIKVSIFTFDPIKCGCGGRCTLTFGAKENVRSDGHRFRELCPHWGQFSGPWLCKLCTIYTAQATDQVGTPLHRSARIQILSFKLPFFIHLAAARHMHVKELNYRYQFG